MKRKVLLIITAVILLVSLWGCSGPTFVADAGPLITREFDIRDFTKVDVQDAFEVTITKSSTYQVYVTANENLFSLMDVSKHGDRLVIRMTNWPIIAGIATLKARISMPELTALSLSGASMGDVKGFASSNDFDAVVSGASSLDMDMQTGNAEFDVSGASRVAGNLRAANAVIGLSGASRIDMAGSAGNTVFRLSGASKGSLPDFNVKDADIELSGASNMMLKVIGKMDVELSGAS